MLSMWPCKHFSHIQVLVPNFFPTPPIKLNPGGQVGGRLLIATHLDQSNYIANQKQGVVNEYNLIVFIRLFQASESCLFQRVSSGFTGFDWWASSKTSCVRRGAHILSIGGDALNELDSCESKWCLKMTIGFLNFSLLIKIYLTYPKFKHLKIIIVTNKYFIKKYFELGISYTTVHLVMY
jgi:hypothetical protein